MFATSSRVLTSGLWTPETPVAPAHSKGSKPFMFDAPLALPQALKANGIKIVSFANNHVMDQGWGRNLRDARSLARDRARFVGHGRYCFADVAAAGG